MIRKYTSADLESVVTLFTQTVHIVSSRHYSPEEVEACAPLQPDMEAWEYYFNRRYTLVMESEDGIIGFGCLNRKGDVVEMLFTHHARQSEGTGSSILEALEKEAVLHGIRELTLTTSATALTFYQKRGYNYHHNEKKAYGDMMFDCKILMKNI